MNKDWLDIDVLEDYLDGKLDAREMHLVEKYALEDPFVAEALEGLSASPKRSLQSISLLQKQLQQRVAEQQNMRKKSVITWQRLSIAATAAVMFVAGSIVFWMKENSRKEELAKQTKKVDVTLAPKESDVAAVTKPNALSAGEAIASPEQARPAAEQEIDKAIAAAKTSAYAAVKAQKKETGTLRRMAVPAAPAGQMMQDAAVEKLNETAVRGYAAKAKMGAPAVVTAFIPQTDAGKKVFSGRVTGGDDGSPLAGVEVRLKGTALRTRTDENGNFSLKADSTLKEGEVIAAYIGFKTEQLLAKANEKLNLVLKPDDNALNEVVVSRANKAEKALQGKVAGVRIQNNEGMPVGGWDQFRDYVRKNNRLRDHLGNTVSVDFMVSDKGRPYDTKVVGSSLGDPYNQEAIRLVQEGPDWQRPVKKKARLSTKIDF